MRKQIQNFDEVSTHSPTVGLISCLLSCYQCASELCIITKLFTTKLANCFIPVFAYPTQELARKETDWEKEIEKDLARTFPYHEMFSEKNSQG